MDIIKVRFKKRSYDVIVGPGAAGFLPDVLDKISRNSPVVIISDRNVENVSARILKGVFDKVGNPLFKIILKPGEQSKSLDVFKGVVKKIVYMTHGHNPVVVALGGGVIGDLAGFVAATYRRGVPLIQIPTTLLAQVDSSVGGKVGIDVSEGKNIVGAFYQPKTVLTDTRFLETLPSREVSNGLAEIIKYAVIKEPEMFTAIEKNIARLRALDMTFMNDVISGCVGIKASVVEKDEFDRKDKRIFLNFGHTLGHAVETACGYSDHYNHGESVSVGMVMAGEIAVRLGFFGKDDQKRLVGLLTAAGLPVFVEKIKAAKIVRACKHDKKFVSGVNRFVLPRSIGKVAVVEDVPETLVRAVVRDFTSS